MRIKMYFPSAPQLFVLPDSKSDIACLPLLHGATERDELRLLSLSSARDKDVKYYTPCRGELSLDIVTVISIYFTQNV
jgi:hypothetical protein